MPARQVVTKKSTKAMRAARHPHHVPISADKIMTRRTHLMSELARLRKRHDAPKTLENVQHLLTRWWSPASWQARAELLKTAEWFLQLARAENSDRNIQVPATAASKF